MAITSEELKKAIGEESQKFREFYLWLEKAMPPDFFFEVPSEHILLIVHSLMGFDLQEYFSTIYSKNAAISLCLDSPDADLRILRNFSMYGIKNYQTYISNSPPPFPNITEPLRIATIYFTSGQDLEEPSLPDDTRKMLYKLVKKRNPEVTDEEFANLVKGMNVRFLRSLSHDRLGLAIDMFFRAKTRDPCQFEVRCNEDWAEQGIESVQIVLAWRNVPKHNFLYRMTRIIYRHGLSIRHFNACYFDPYKTDSILLMSFGLHGIKGQAVWETADMIDFLREMAVVKYFASFDLIDQRLIEPGVISGNHGNMLRAMVTFVHQALVHVNPNIYTIAQIEEAICRHPELTAQICKAFHYKFSPDDNDEALYSHMYREIIHAIDKLDTGQEENDIRRRAILRQGINFIHYSLKTNFYRHNYTSLSFRLDPKYLNEIPFDRSKKFPEIPYGIFFVKGMHFFAFHIRFQDLARGGVRTIFPEHHERSTVERNTVFTECYNLAFTQQMKNKDIPEGGAKAVIFLQTDEHVESESVIYARELQAAQVSPVEIEKQVQTFRQEQRLEYLHHTQRSFVESLISIVNCEPDGRLRAKYIVDYWKHPEYLYLGPDENMHDDMIEWIAQYSKKYNYRPGSSFISGKPKVGINHKEYGVTSLGVNVYVDAILHYMGIDPLKDRFKVKMSGGPDGDVAGNEICNLHRLYSKTAQLVALTDISGTIYDPEGLDLSILVDLFHDQKPIRYYPVTLLHETGFLVDKQVKRSQETFALEMLCLRKTQGKIVEDWLSTSDANALLRNNVHQVKADIFIPAGGRPRTLNENNYTQFLDDKGIPTARAIVEGANLYLTPHARRALEELGVLIIKDSSANKTGVICSSFEVLCGLALGDDLFLTHKNRIVPEILHRLIQCAEREANLLLRTHRETKQFLTEISDQTSAHINYFTSQLLNYLESKKLSNDPENPLTNCFLSYALPLLKDDFQKELINHIPEPHKKAIIACHVASHAVYERGLAWTPSIVDILEKLL